MITEENNAAETSETKTEATAAAPIAPEAAKSDAERLQRALAVVEKKPAAEARPEKPPEAPKKPEEMVSPQVAAVLKREKALDEKKNSIAEERKALEADKAAWAKEKGSTTDYHGRLRKLDTRIQALKEAGIADPETWLRDTYYSLLPEDKQPKDLRHRQQVSEEVLELRKANEDLRSRWEKREAEEAAAKKAAEEKAAQEAKAAQDQAALDAYLGRVTESVPAESVFLKDLLANEPEEAKGLLFNAALLLARQQEKEPDPQEVAAVVEKHLAAQYERAERAKKTTKQVEQRPHATKQLTAKQTATPTHTRSTATTDAERLKRATERAEGIWK